MPPTTLYLLRHGELERRAEVYYGHADLRLSASGRAQGEAAAHRLAEVPLVGVHSSDLSRAREFAQIIAARHGLAVEAHASLREMAVGVLEGVTFEEAHRLYPELAVRTLPSMLDFAMPGGGESLRQVAARVLPTLHALIERHRGQPFALVGHQSVNQVVISEALGLGVDGIFRVAQSFGALSVLEWRRRGPRLVSLNESLTAQSAPPVEQIRVRAIEFEGRHGWHAEERLLLRTFRVDLCVDADLGAASRSDKLRETIDYRALAQRAVRVGVETSHRLIESLAGAIGDALLEVEPRLRRASVTVYKLKPPGLEGDPSEVSATVVRERAGA